MTKEKLDTARLASELRARMRGEVRFDEGSRALYATDASNYRQVPIGVVFPRSEEDVTAAIEVCHGFGAPILSRGCGTSLAGQCCNTAVILDMSRHLRNIVALSPTTKSARVEPGVVLDHLRDAAEAYHLTFAPDPATHTHCTLGGMIGNNSCGVHSLMGGKTVDNIEELDILTYDGLWMRVGATSEQQLEGIIREGGRRGEIYARLKALRDRYATLIRSRYPAIPRRVSGYNLDQLLPESGFHVARALVGTEGTCVTVLGATVRLVDSPPARSLLVLGYADIYTAADRVCEILAHKPIGLEGVDDGVVSAIKAAGMRVGDLGLLPKGGGWLLVEFGGQNREEANGRARALADQLQASADPPAIRLCDGPKEAKRMWEIRESGLAATARALGEREAWAGWEDAAVAPAKLGGYLRDFRRLLNQYGYGGALYGHFGEGCIHVRIDFDLRSAEGIGHFRSFVHEAADLVVRYGGSLSGEHGDGQARAELLPKMFGDELVQAFREFKSIWDPAGKMNPGKLVDPFGVDEHLRLGAAYNPWQPATHFKFPADQGSVARASLRCVGVGKCRRAGGGTMCPSYKVTREEQHSTRGRARLLFEVLQGEVLSGGWKNEALKDALDLCLACKGCKSDCPASVDMATYKAEFLSHYYQGRLRPRHAYALGLIYWWARLGSQVPRLANLLTQTPFLSAAVKLAAGLALQRHIPPLARRTFRQWFRSRPPGSTERGDPGQVPVLSEAKDGCARRVVLWPDTFNNYFRPQTAQAAVAVLEAAGFRVELPSKSLCCGRPLYDYGMLGLARRQLRQVLEMLRPQIVAGVPVVGLEPSCVAVFRDELSNLFPGDERAAQLSRQTVLLSEFLQGQAGDFQLPQFRRKALAHGHCHHRAVMGFDAEHTLLARLGLDLEVLDSGCCGMAGGFGFEAEHYDISMKVGHQVLLPAVCSASPDTLIIADGFSCREQIAQGAGREALHLAEVLEMALRQKTENWKPETGN
jgi:FAD/FMN-containing dehydrogenase/Fe-S oxidoreductase